VTGVSGSGKSSLINQTLHPALAKRYHNSGKSPLAYREITGLENLDKVIEVSQSPIGKLQDQILQPTQVFSPISGNCLNRPLRLRFADSAQEDSLLM